MRSISRRGKASTPGCMFFFFGLFALLGTLAFVGFFVLPLTTWMSAQNWPEVPCRIISSTVGVHSGSEGGNTYSVEIVYEYSYQGLTYQGERYDASGSWSSSGRKGKQKVVDLYPAGEASRCYVNPKDPEEAVLSRRFPLAILFGLFSLIFCAVGFGGIIFVFRLRRKSDTPIHQPIANLGTPDLEDDGPMPRPLNNLELSPNVSPVAKFIFLTVFGLIWNGFVGFVIFMMFREGGQGDGCAKIFMIPFALVGLLLLVGIPYQFLALFNPKPLFRLSRNLRLGEEVDVDWTFSGAAGRIRHLKVILVGREQARYRRGTNTHTATEDFHESIVVDTTHGVEIQSGHGIIKIPAESMHSFRADRNKFLWFLKVEGDIRFWPDVSAEFELTVLPGDPSGFAHERTNW